MLEKLELSYNHISDLGPLVGLSKLTVLDLSGNKIKRVDALKGLVNLTELDLSDNQLSSASKLAPLAKLIYLNLFDHPLGYSITKTEKNCPSSAQSILLKEYCQSKLGDYHKESEEDEG